jgi:hypothetical protein
VWLSLLQFFLTIDAERCVEVGKMKVSEESHKSKATDKEILGLWSRTIMNFVVRPRFACLLSEMFSFHFSQNI